VRSLQRRLARLGFTPGPIDGRYGPLTTSAVRRFQQERHLSGNGVAGPRTVVALTPRAPRRPTQPAPAAHPHHNPTPVQPPVARRVQPGPQLPVGPVLLALGLLGLATLAHSYRRTRRQVRSAPGSAPAAEAPASRRAASEPGTPPEHVTPDPETAHPHVTREPAANAADRVTHDRTHTTCTQNPVSSPVHTLNHHQAPPFLLPPQAGAIALPATLAWRWPTSGTHQQAHGGSRPRWLPRPRSAPSAQPMPRLRGWTAGRVQPGSTLKRLAGATGGSGRLQRKLRGLRVARYAPAVRRRWKDQPARRVPLHQRRRSAK
jgi:hypothetical protein